jgi:DNA-binding protein HU-beta
MNKAELVNEVAEVLGTKKEARAAVDCVFSTITKALAAQDKVAIAGFGTFKTVEKKAMRGINPQTGAVIEIKARMAPKFSPGKALKEAVQNK